MSDTRIVVEQPCEHGYIGGHWWHPHKKIAMSMVPENHWCPGGRRRVLTPGAVAAEIGDTFIDYQTVPPKDQWKRIFNLLDALAKSEQEGTEQ